ncbi:hypothetical protein [Paenibacillus taichungensis]
MDNKLTVYINRPVLNHPLILRIREAFPEHQLLNFDNKRFVFEKDAGETRTKFAIEIHDRYKIEFDSPNDPESVARAFLIVHEYMSKI